MTSHPNVPPATIRMTETIIVVPCYNEASRFDTGSFHRFAAGVRNVRFLFVNDGSTDGTAGVLEGMRQGAPESIGILSLEANVGKAEAVRQGIVAALEQEVAYVGFWDADLATPLDAIPSFIELLTDRPHIDVVVGSRVRLLGRNIERRALRHYLGRVFATAASLVLGLPVYDTQCGAKLFRVTEQVRRVFARPFASRWVFDVEILARWASRRNDGISTALDTCVYELPLTEWRDVGDSKLRARDYFRAAIDLLVIYRRYRWNHGRELSVSEPGAGSPAAPPIDSHPRPEPTVTAHGDRL